MRSPAGLLRRRFGHWDQDRFLRHTAITLAGTKLGDFFNLVYRLAMVRLLSIEDYGTFNSLIAFLGVVTQFLAPFQPALTRFLAEYISRREFSRLRFVLRGVGKTLGLFSLIVFLAFLAASGRISAYLQLADRRYPIMIGFMVALAVGATVPGALLQGAQRFTAISCLSAGSAFLKLLAGIILVCLGGGVAGAFGGFIVGLVAGVGGMVWVMLRYFSRLPPESRQERSTTLLPIYRYFLPSGLLLGSYWALTNLDVILVKHFFPSREVGFYAVAQMVGMIILFLPGAVSIVVLPTAAAARAQGRDSRTLLKRGLAVTAVFCGAGALICRTMPTTVLRLIAGRAEPASVELVPWFALAMSFYALVQLMVFYHLAVHRVALALPMVLLAVAEFATIYFFHPTLKSVIGVVIGYAIITFFVSLSMVKYPNRS